MWCIVVRSLLTGKMVGYRLRLCSGNLFTELYYFFFKDISLTIFVLNLLLKAKKAYSHLLSKTSKFVLKMAYFNNIRSHYLNQCWPIISKVLWWHSAEDDFTRYAGITCCGKFQPEICLKVPKAEISSWKQGFWGHRGAPLVPTGPRWAPCWPHEPCYLW